MKKIIIFSFIISLFFCNLFASDKSTIFFEWFFGGIGFASSGEKGYSSGNIEVLKFILLNSKNKIGIGSSLYRGTVIFPPEPSPPSEFLGETPAISCNLNTYLPIYIYFIPRHKNIRLSHGEYSGVLKKMCHYGYISFSSWAKIKPNQTDLSAYGITGSLNNPEVGARIINIGVGYQFVAYKRTRPFYIYPLYSIEVGYSNLHINGFEHLGGYIEGIDMEQFYLHLNISFVPNSK